MKVAHLCTVLRLGHGDQELEDGLRLGHEGGDGVDDGGELGVGFDTCRVQEASRSAGSNIAQRRAAVATVVRIGTEEKEQIAKRNNKKILEKEKYYINPLVRERKHKF